MRRERPYRRRESRGQQLAARFGVYGNAKDLVIYIEEFRVRLDEQLPPEIDGCILYFDSVIHSEAQEALAQRLTKWERANHAQ